MENNITIGVDHGYAAMKTRNCVFPTGLAAHDYKPFTHSGLLTYQGRYYVTGSKRQVLHKDKMGTDDYYLLTLAAIAREINFRNAVRTARVRLAAGMPLSNFARERDRFREYLFRGGHPVAFQYEEQDFLITITDVPLFPQGYAAAVVRREMAEQPSMILCDIGGWTVDLMHVRNRIPDTDSCLSLESGVIRCVDRIMEQIRRHFGLSITPEQVESVLRGEDGCVNDEIYALIDYEAREYVQRLLFSILQSGMDIHVTPVIFMGGGAALLKRYMPENETICKPIILDNVHLNAIAYERLTEALC